MAGPLSQVSTDAYGNPLDANGYVVDPNTQAGLNNGFRVTSSQFNPDSPNYINTSGFGVNDGSTYTPPPAPAPTSGFQSWKDGSQGGGAGPTITDSGANSMSMGGGAAPNVIDSGAPAANSLTTASPSPGIQYHPGYEPGGANDPMTGLTGSASNNYGLPTSINASALIAAGINPLQYLQQYGDPRTSGAGTGANAMTHNGTPFSPEQQAAEAKWEKQYGMNPALWGVSLQAKGIPPPPSFTAQLSPGDRGAYMEYNPETGAGFQPTSGVTNTSPYGSTAAPRNWGANENLNRAIANATGYQGDFGHGEYGAWAALHPTEAARSNTLFPGVSSPSPSPAQSPTPAPAGQSPSPSPAQSPTPIYRGRVPTPTGGLSATRPIYRNPVITASPAPTVSSPRAPYNPIRTEGPLRRLNALPNDGWDWQNQSISDFLIDQQNKRRNQ